MSVLRCSIDNSLQISEKLAKTAIVNVGVIRFADQQECIEMGTV